MAKLHWIVFVIVGFILTFGSWRISMERFVLFFYAGFVFLLVGIVKFIYRGKNEESKKIDYGMRPAHVPNKMQNKPMNPHNTDCQRCRAPSRINANFCSNCGNRV